MSIKTRLVLIVLVPILVLGVVNIFMSRWLLSNSASCYTGSIDVAMKSQSQRLTDDRVKEFEFTTNQSANNALAQASILSRAEPVMRAYEVALGGNIENESDPECQKAREMLRREMRPYLDGYQIAQGNKALKLHYHLPNARSLARLWQQGYQVIRNGKKLDISDDISSFRPSVVQVNRSHQPVTGIEVGVGGFDLRGVAPVTSPTGKHLGSVEVLVPFAGALDGLRRNGREMHAAYMSASFLEIAQSLQDESKYPRVDDKFVWCAGVAHDSIKKMLDSEFLSQGLKETTIKGVSSYQLSASPIHDYTGKTVGVIVMAFDMTDDLALYAKAATEGDKLQQSGFLWTLSTVIVIGLLMTAIGLSLVNRIMKPLTGAMNLAEKISEGDLQVQLPTANRDEIGRMIAAFGRMLDYLQGTSEVARRIAQNDLTVEVKPKSSKDVLGQVFATMVNNLKDIIYQLSDSSRELVSAATEISSSSETLSRGATNQSDQVKQVSAAVEEMSVSLVESSKNSGNAGDAARSATTTAENGGRIVNETIVEMQKIADVVRDSSSSIALLAKSADQIGQIIGVIDDIADQTNLLALNAAIEAARAGEQGRGFAVVADEVRKLAERTGKATGEITDMIKGIQGQTGDAVRAMETGIQQVERGRQLADRAGESLDEIVTTAQRVTQLISQMAGAIEEQSLAAGDIARNVDSIAHVTAETAVGARESASASEALNHQAEGLRQLVTRFRVS